MITLGAVFMFVTVLTAHFQGRSLLLWFCVGVLTTPILSFLILLVLGKASS